MGIGMWLTCRYKYRPCPLGQQEFFVSSAKLKTHLRLRRLLCQGHRHQFPYSSRCYVRQGVNIVGDFYQPAQNSRNIRVTTAAHLRNILSGTSWNLEPPPNAGTSLILQNKNLGCSYNLQKDLLATLCFVIDRVRSE